MSLLSAAPIQKSLKKLERNASFIALLQENDDLFYRFWTYAKSSSEKHLAAIGKDMDDINLYDVHSVRAKAKTIANELNIISSIYHSLGIMPYFPSHPLFDYSLQVDKTVKSYYPNTLYSLVSKNDEETCFTLGYINLYFQQSLLESLEAFSMDKTGFDGNILKECLQNLSQSIIYTKALLEDEEVTEKIIEDLESGKTLIFTTGRKTPELHAINIVLSKNYIAMCDRFDDFPTFKGGENGVYIYQISKPFSELSQEDKQKIINWLTIAIDKLQYSLELKLFFDLPIEPNYTLAAKKQTKGSCRYSSKKQGISGLIALAALKQIEDQNKSKAEIDKLMENVYFLQKEFKRFDRLFKLDNLIASKAISTEQKDHLLILALLRNYNPEKPNDKTDSAIAKKIAQYFQRRFKESDACKKNLCAIFKSLKVSFEHVHQIEARLAENGVILGNIQSHRTVLKEIFLQDRGKFIAKLDQNSSKGLYFSELMRKRNHQKRKFNVRYHRNQILYSIIIRNEKPFSVKM